MNKVPLMYRMCMRKKPLSEKIADIIINKAKTEGKLLYKYYCPYCFKWHLTSKPNDNRAKTGNLYIIRNNNKIFEITEEQYNESKKSKNSDIIITREQYNKIPKLGGRVIFNKEFPDTKSLLNFINS